MAEVTDAGYSLKSQNDWFADEVALYKGIDPSWNLDPSTPDGLKAAHDAEIFYALDEALLRAYNSKDPEKAIGIELDIISSIAGLRRKPGTRSDVLITFAGNPGAMVLAGAIVESAITGERWITEQAYTILPTGNVEAQAFSVSTGPTAADANTLTKIVTVMSGIVSCTNLTPANLGLDPQPDSSLRIERRRRVGNPSNNQIDSLISGLLGVPDVRRVQVYNNPTGSAAVSELNPHGIAAHSFAAIVDGGSDEDVGMAIYLRLNPGTGMAQPSGGAAVSVPVTSPVKSSNIQIVKFTRPQYVDINLNIQITGADYPVNIADQIKEAVMEYSTGSLLDPNIGFSSSGYDIGDSVFYSSMFTPINKVIGVYPRAAVASLQLNGAMANVPIAYNQLARWQESNITVTVV